MEGTKKRTLYEPIKRHLSRPQHTIIIGARQVGKTTLMRQLHNELKDAGKAVTWLNLEQKDILKTLNDSPLNLLSYLPIQNGQEKTTVFIDEIQYLADPSNFLKLIYDEYSHKIKIVASGSSVFYIDTKFNDSLAGRKRIFRMNTCTFGEHLLLGGHDELYEEFVRITSMPNARTSSLPILESEMRKYMRFGGYPAVVAEPDMEEKRIILEELRDSFLHRDIKEAGVQNADAFYQLFRLLAAQNGNLLNVNELSKSLRIKGDTVQRYINVMDKCCHVGIVRPFFRNLGKELTKMPKLYVLDSGLRRCLIGNLQSELTPTEEGSAWEGVVYRALLERYAMEDINFWRTTADNEVDFVLPNAQSSFSIEVKYSVGAAKASRYSKFNSTYPQIPLRFIEGFPLSESTLYQLSNFSWLHDDSPT